MTRFADPRLLPMCGPVDQIMHQLLRIFHRQQPQHQLIHQCEDGGIRADAQRERGHRHRREQRTAAQVAQREFDVGQNSGHVNQTTTLRFG